MVKAIVILAVLLSGCVRYYSTPVIIPDTDKERQLKIYDEIQREERNIHAK
jgi:hypothetical protein